MHRHRANGLVVAVFFLVASSAIAAPRQLTLEERVQCRLAVETVYAAHRLELVPGTAPRAIDQAALRARVQRELSLTAVVEQRLGQALGAADLQREMERIALSTHRPDILREIFVALASDPFLVAECLARPQRIESLATIDDQRDVEELSPAPATPAPVDDALLRLPAVRAETCTPGTWRPMSDVSVARWGQGSDQGAIVVWTGDEMIVWGGIPDGGSQENGDGAAYDPVTDSWIWIEPPPAAIPAPTRAEGLWAGSELIVLGYDPQDLHPVGLRYAPSTRTYRAVSMPADGADPGAPLVWTGVEVLTATHAYDPAMDTWRTLPAQEPPATYVIQQRDAVWTGEEMLILGEFGGVNMVRRYAPSTDAWSSSSANPRPSLPSAGVAWTGSELVFLNDASGTVAHYAPGTDTWSFPESTGAPIERGCETVLFTGAKMVIPYGGVFDLATSTWSMFPSSEWGVNDCHAVWTGREVVTWGIDEEDLGERVDPETCIARPLFRESVPDSTGRAERTVSTGPETIFWRIAPQNDVFPWGSWLHDAVTNGWRVIADPTNYSGQCSGPAVAWSGSELILWGGFDGRWTCDTGARYDVATDTWRAMAIDPAVQPHFQHGAVWTGSEFLTWGGIRCEVGVFGRCWRLRSNTGAFYDPLLDTWRVIPVDDTTPSPRTSSAFYWTGTKAVVYGGGIEEYPPAGGVFDPATMTWRPIAPPSFPNTDLVSSAWAGNGLAIHAGDSYGGSATSFYDPATETWHDLAPGPAGYVSVFASIGDRVVLYSIEGLFPEVLDVDAGTWSPLEQRTAFVPGRRIYPAHAWSGHELILWGGYTTDTQSGGAAYCPVPSATPAIAAEAGAEQTLECTGNGRATAHLDGSASTPAADLVSYDWSLGEDSLGSGMTLDAPIPYGEHLVVLTVADVQGTRASDTVRISVVDTQPPTGGITAPTAGECVGPAALPVMIADDFADSCSREVRRTYEPAGGPYSTHGDHVITVTAMDFANATIAQAVFTIDTQAPVVTITAPPDQLVFPRSIPFANLFVAADDDGATGGIVAEVLELDGCVVYDGATYGDRDGLLSDEALVLDGATLCRIADRCGRRAWNDPTLTVRVTDCGGNSAGASTKLTGDLQLPENGCGSAGHVRRPKATRHQRPGQPEQKQWETVAPGGRTPTAR